MNRPYDDLLSRLRMNDAEVLARPFGYATNEMSGPEFLQRESSTIDGYSFFVGPFLFLDEDVAAGWGVMVELPHLVAIETLLGRSPTLTLSAALGASELAVTILERTAVGPDDWDEAVEEVVERFAEPVKRALDRLRTAL